MANSTATDAPPKASEVELLADMLAELRAIREAFEQIAVAVAGMGSMFGGMGGPPNGGGGFLGG